MRYSLRVYVCVSEWCRYCYHVLFYVVESEVVYMVEKYCSALLANFARKFAAL